jgi:hypothetical protein
VSRLAPWVAVTGSRLGLLVSKHVNRRAGWATYQAGKKLAHLLTWRARRQWQRRRVEP